MAQEKEGGSGEIGGPHTIETWIEGVEAGWPEGDIGRMIIHGLPRWFHALTAARQREALGREPRTTGTKWDALLAAMVEHLAELHGHPVPEWVNEPQRFLDETWVVAKTQEIRIERACGSRRRPSSGTAQSPTLSTSTTGAANAMAGSLDKERLLQLFDELSQELRWSRTRAQIYVMGGAARASRFVPTSTAPGQPRAEVPSSVAVSIEARERRAEVGGPHGQATRSSTTRVRPTARNALSTWPMWERWSGFRSFRIAVSLMSRRAASSTLVMPCTRIAV